MAYSPLTEEGKKFIREVCKGNGNTLLQGKHSYPLPYTSPPATQTWICNIKDPKDGTKTIQTNQQLGEALIYWFDKYCNDFQLDANVIAAQAFAESTYFAWNYAGGDSTASGINQFTMLTLFGIIVENMGSPIIVSPVSMTPMEIAEITAGLTNPKSKNSYSVKSSLPQDAIHNRPILHQNVINNPGIMIKAQCYYMKNIANKSDSLTSTSLFCYSRGLYMSKTYSRAIQKCDEGHTTQLDYKNEGLTYVMKIFGILGDKDNWLRNKGLGKNYKPSGYYFGYDATYFPNDKATNAVNPKNLRIQDTWNPYLANVDESGQYNLQNDITETNRDIVVEELSKYAKYKFIYYPENNYKRKQTPKLQLVLHHTASGGNASGDILWWEHEVARTGTQVATAFILMRDGTILQLFSTYYWAWHLGIEDKLFTEYGTQGINNTTLNSQSIGIEIDNWGGLINSGGNWYPAASPKSQAIPQKDVIEYKAPQYPHGYHGYTAFEKYTTEQISSLRVLISAIVKGNPKIALNYSGDGMWGTYNNSTNQWMADNRAFAETPGIWTHVSYQPNKSDCQPQPELVDLLKTLK